MAEGEAPGQRAFAAGAGPAPRRTAAARRSRPHSPPWNAAPWWRRAAPGRPPAPCRRSAPSCRGRSPRSRRTRSPPRPAAPSPCAKPVTTRQRRAAQHRDGHDARRGRSCSDASLPISDTAMPISPASVNSTVGPGSQAGGACHREGRGQEGHGPGAQHRHLQRMHAVSGDPGHGAAVRQHRAEVEQPPAPRARRRRRVGQDQQRDGEGARRQHAADQEGEGRPRQRRAGAGQREGHRPGECPPPPHASDTARDCARAGSADRRSPSAPAYRRPAQPMPASARKASALQNPSASSAKPRCASAVAPVPTR